MLIFYSFSSRKEEAQCCFCLTHLQIVGKDSDNLLIVSILLEKLQSLHLSLIDTRIYELQLSFAFLSKQQDITIVEQAEHHIFDIHVHILRCIFSNDYLFYSLSI